MSTNSIEVKKKFNSEKVPTAILYTDCQIAKDTPRKLDFLILAIETLQINATDSLFSKAKRIGLPADYSSRVQFWKLRCTNPMRKSHSNSTLNFDQVDSLAELISTMAETLYPIIRQLLSSKESEKLNNERWLVFRSRLKSLIRERMNIQRSYVSYLLNEDDNNFFRELLVILSLSCGEGGANRLKASLYHKN